MRGAIQILIVLAVLLCGSHLSPAEAEESRGVPAAAAGFDLHQGDTDAAQDGHADVAHAGHHHCPIAPDQDGSLALAEPAAIDALLFAAPVASLRSLATAPPTEPPSA